MLSGVKACGAASRLMNRPKPGIAFALLAGVCCSEGDPLPEPGQVQTAAPAPAVTPVPFPDPACIAQIGARRPGSSPRKLRHVPIRFPEFKAPTRFSGLWWIVEGEIDTDGSIASVRVLRRIKTDPPWPEGEEAISEAIRQWRFEPTCVDGRPVRVKLHATVHVGLR
jgi:hypothetical protein